MMILDNPIWQALSTRQQYFNIGNDMVKYFPAEVAPFIALENWDKNDIKALLQYMPGDRSFFVLQTQPIQLPDELEVTFTTPLYQMVCNELKPGTQKDIHIQPLSATHIPQMVELTKLTKPGPFYNRTIEFGNYTGVFENDTLIAMAGERLKTTGYTEVSAICTHPDHLGKGYGSYLLTHAAQKVIDNGHTPFLHVRSDNENAIALYKKRGFHIRADIFFAVFKKKIRLKKGAAIF